VEILIPILLKIISQTRYCSMMPCKKRKELWFLLSIPFGKMYKLSRKNHSLRATSTLLGKTKFDKIIRTGHKDSLKKRTFTAQI
jgi:hypothetical protein